MVEEAYPTCNSDLQHLELILFYTLTRESHFTILDILMLQKVYFDHIVVEFGHRFSCTSDIDT